MQIFKRRPLALACFSFLASLYLGYAVFEGKWGQIPLGLGLIFIAVILGAAAVFCAKKHRAACRSLVTAVLALLLAAAGFFTACHAFGTRGTQAETQCGEGEITLRIEELTHAAEYGTMGLGRLITEDGEIAVRFSAEGPYEAGQILIGTGTVSPFEEKDYDFSEKSYYLSSGVLLDVEISEVTETRPSSSGRLAEAFRSLNRRLRAILQVELERDTFGLISGMLLGNREDMPRTVERDFSELGISHILALSGLHLTVLCGFLERILFAVPRKLRYGILILFTVAYAILTGGSSSVVRAALMLILVYLCFFLGRRCDTITTLFAVATAMCAVFPYGILSVSFQLSFLAMLGCVTSARLIPKRKRHGRGIAALYSLRDSVFAGSFVCLVTLPAIGLISGRISLLAPLANLLFVPLSTAILTLGILLFPLRHVPVLSGLTVFLTESLARLTLTLAETAASWHVGVFSVVSGARNLLLLCLTLLLLLLFFCRPRAKRAVVILAFALFLSVFAAADIEEYLSYEDAVLTTISYKKNDIFTLRLEGNTYLIDVSDGSISATGKGTASLRADGYREIDRLILTHYHQRHIRALRRIAEEMYLSTLCLPTPERPEDEILFEALCKEAEALGVTVLVYDRTEGTRLLLGDAVLETMEFQLLSRSTHPTVGFSLTANGVCFAYLGLSVEEGPTNFDERMLAEADAVYLGSHGPVQKEPWKGRAMGAVFVTDASTEYYSGDTVGRITEKQILVLQ